MSKNIEELKSKISWKTIVLSGIASSIVVISATTGLISNLKSLSEYLSFQKIKFAIIVFNLVVSLWATIKMMRFCRRQEAFDIEDFEKFRMITDIDQKLLQEQIEEISLIKTEIEDIEDKINEEESKKESGDLNRLNNSVIQDSLNILKNSKQALEEKVNNLNDKYLEEKKEVAEGKDPDGRRDKIKKWHEQNIERVGILIKQFAVTTVAFAISLVLTYIFIFTDGYFNPKNKSLTSEKPDQIYKFTINTNSEPDTPQPSATSTTNDVTITYNPRRNEGSINTNGKENLIVFKPADEREIELLNILSNIFNFVGCLAVFSAFSALYITTVNEGRTTARFYVVPILALIIYVSVVIAFTQLYSKLNLDKTISLNLLDLAAGLFNGLAGTLLFGRYVSIEHSLRYTERFKSLELKAFGYEIPFKNFLIPFGIVFLLPIYSLAQPLFGTLQIDAFGNPEYFQLGVYFVCLIGKIWFFYLTYLLIKTNSLHLYIYGLVAKVGNFRELEDSLTDKD